MEAATVVSVDELKRAWGAVASGEFRVGATAVRDRVRSKAWQPDEPVIVVAGTAGRVGASTVAIALATVADRDVRVIECSPAHRTGMMIASTSELGVDEFGWRRGARDSITIERTTASFARPSDVPLPAPTPCELTIIDIGWDLTQLFDEDSWLAATVGSVPLVLVCVATVPGIRALDASLRLIGHRDDVVCAVVGPPRRKWAPVLNLVADSVGVVDDSGRLFAIPEDRSIAVNGLTQDPLPARLVSACRPILEQLSVDVRGGSSHDVRR